MANSFMELISMSEFGDRWRDVPGFPGYMVSDKGFVVNVKTCWILKPKTDKDGDLVVSMRRDNKYYKIQVEWLVRTQFR